MKIATLVPAYGRDYTSKKDVLADYLGHKDFILQDISSPWDGKPMNKADVESLSDYTAVKLRYNSLRKIEVVEVRK